MPEISKEDQNSEKQPETTNTSGGRLLELLKDPGRKILQMLAGIKTERPEKRTEIVGRPGLSEADVQELIAAQSNFHTIVQTAMERNGIKPTDPVSYEPVRKGEDLVGATVVLDIQHGQNLRIPYGVYVPSSIREAFKQVTDSDPHAVGDVSKVVVYNDDTGCRVELETAQGITLLLDLTQHSDELTNGEAPDSIRPHVVYHKPEHSAEVMDNAVSQADAQLTQLDLTHLANDMSTFAREVIMAGITTSDSAREAKKAREIDSGEAFPMFRSVLKSRIDRSVRQSRGTDSSTPQAPIQYERLIENQVQQQTDEAGNNVWIYDSNNRRIQVRDEVQDGLRHRSASIIQTDSTHNESNFTIPEAFADQDPTTLLQTLDAMNQSGLSPAQATEIMSLAFQEEERIVQAQAQVEQAFPDSYKQRLKMLMDRRVSIAFSNNPLGDNRIHNEVTPNETLYPSGEATHHVDKLGNEVSCTLSRYGTGFNVAFVNTRGTERTMTFIEDIPFEFIKPDEELSEEGKKTILMDSIVAMENLGFNAESIKEAFVVARSTDFFGK